MVNEWVEFFSFVFKNICICIKKPYFHCCFLNLSLCVLSEMLCNWVLHHFVCLVIVLHFLRLDRFRFNIMTLLELLFLTLNHLSSLCMQYGSMLHSVCCVFVCVFLFKYIVMDKPFSYSLELCHLLVAYT